MTDTVKYKVAREHTGDDLTENGDGIPTVTARHFVNGDTRTAFPATVKHLVDLGVLEAPKAKAAPAHKNKAAPAAANKDAAT